MSVQPSLIVIGRRGSGLSSFALIAARLTGFTIVDVDAHFVSEHGMSRTACLRDWGEHRYRNTAACFLQTLLSRHQHNRILVCASEAADSNSQALVRACASGAYTIMISRDDAAIQQHLGLTPSPEVQRILSATQQLCRRVSNIEYYNLPEPQGPETVSDRVYRALRSDLPPRRRIRRLRNVTRDVHYLLKMLGYSTGGNETLRSSDALQSREFPSYTTLSFQEVLQKRSHMIALDCVSDALELLVSISAAHPLGLEDTDHICEAFQLLRRHFQLPIIYHVDWTHETPPSGNTTYADFSRQGLRLLPEYATIDLRCSDEEISAFVGACCGHTKVIAHRTFCPLEEFSWRDPSLLEQCQRAAALGCHHIRFVRFAMNTSEDRDCAAFQILANSVTGIPVSANITDRYARSSSVNNIGLTAVSQEVLSNPIDLTLLPSFRDLAQARFASFVHHPLHFHIYGASVDYSLSPAMHNVAFEVLGMGHNYSPRQSSSLEGFRNLLDDTFGGASLSLPFKSTVMSLVDTVSEPARIIQAVNTVLPRRDGVAHKTRYLVNPVPNTDKNRAGKITALHGENTDWLALRTCIQRQLSAANSVDSSTAALVIGAGGMARATVYALMDLGVRNIVIWNRSIARAELLVANYSVYATSLATPGNSWQTKFRILPNLTDPWPADMNQPTIIVCTPPAHTINNIPGLDFTVPEPWFESMTGGVIVEVSFRITRGCDYILTHYASYLTKRRRHLFCVKRTAMRTRVGQSSSRSSFLLNRAALNLSCSPGGMRRGTR
jgi:shikimate 5-dehydrogenase